MAEINKIKIGEVEYDLHATNADTLDGKHADEFVSQDDIRELISNASDKIYKQNEEPTDAPDGSLWVDMDEEGGGSSGGSAGVSSWNDLTDKPFGETLDTLTWDGNTDGLHNFQGVLYKVSDVVLTADDFANGGSVALNNGEPIEFKRDDLSIEYFEGKEMIMLEIDYSSAYFMIIPDLGEQFAAAGYKPGVYFLNKEERCLSSLTINGYTGFPVTKKIDKKYLPNIMPEVTTEDNGKFLRVVDGAWAAVSVPNAEEASF